MKNVCKKKLHNSLVDEAYFNKRSDFCFNKDITMFGRSGNFVSLSPFKMSILDEVYTLPHEESIVLHVFKCKKISVATFQESPLFARVNAERNYVQCIQGLCDTVSSSSNTSTLADKINLCDLNCHSRTQKIH